MPRSRWAIVVAGLLVIGVGLLPMLDALGVIAGAESRMNAPRWVVFTAGALFFIVGLWLLLRGIARDMAANTVGGAVALAIVVGLAAILNWIAFGSGGRDDCTGGIAAFGISLPRLAAEFECRAAFGWFALLMNFLFLRGIAGWMAQRAPASRVARALEKGTELAIGLILLPFVLVGVAAMKLKNGWDKLAEKQKSEAPPKC